MKLMKLMRGLVFLIFSAALLSHVAFAELSTDSRNYVAGDTVHIFGNAGAGNALIALQVDSPGGPIYVSQVEAGSSGDYYDRFALKEDAETGTYTAYAAYDSVVEQQTFSVVPMEGAFTVETGKPTYLTGQVVHITGMLRDDDGFPVENMAVALVVKNAVGGIVFVSQAATNDHGEYESTFRIPYSARPGMFTVHAAYDDGSASANFNVLPAVVINEIMYDSSIEYVELYNPSGLPVDVAGWTLSDSDEEDTLSGFNGGTTVIPANSYAVVTGTGAAIAADAIHLITNDGDIGDGLSDTGEALYLNDISNNLIDSVNYSDAWGGDTGSSLERVDPLGASNDGRNWAAGIHEGGTPGAQNSIYGAGDVAITYFDAPRYTDGQAVLSVKVINMGTTSRTVELTVSENIDRINSSSFVLAPGESGVESFLWNPGAGVHNLCAIADIGIDYNPEDNLKFAVVEAFEQDTAQGVSVGEFFHAGLLAPGRVPGGASFNVIAVLMNLDSRDADDVNVTLGLPQEEEIYLQNSGDSLAKSIGTLDGNELGRILAWNVSASPHLDDDQFGERTLSLVAEGIIGGAVSIDADTSVIEIISHSSPVLSVALSMPGHVEAGWTYPFMVMAFNTGNEPAYGVTVTLEMPDGLKTDMPLVTNYDTLDAGEYRLITYMVAVESQGEYEVSAAIEDQSKKDGSAYTITKSTSTGEPAENSRIEEQIAVHRSRSSGNAPVNDDNENPASDNDENTDDYPEQNDEQHESLETEIRENDDVPGKNPSNTVKPHATGMITGAAATASLAVILAIAAAAYFGLRSSKDENGNLHALFRRYNRWCK